MRPFIFASVALIVALAALAYWRGGDRPEVSVSHVEIPLRAPSSPKAKPAPLVKIPMHGVDRRVEAPRTEENHDEIRQQARAAEEKQLDNLRTEAADALRPTKEL